MLDLSQVLPSIGAMSAEAGRRRARQAKLLDEARTRAGDAEAWAEAQARLAAGKPNWLAAVGETPPGVMTPLPGPPPAVYTALATDGSQIPLDRHAAAPCYLLNVGEIVLHYGTGERPRLTSQATLHYKDEEIYLSEGRGDPVPLSEKVLANRRLLAESAALAALIAENHSRLALALVDDPLILWTPPGDAEEEQKKVVAEFCEMLRAGQTAGLPVAGYVSRPGGRDVVGALRVGYCRPGCEHENDSPCRGLAPLTDAALFTGLLKTPGDRSPVYASAARTLDAYPDDQKVFFYYLSVGEEIARVEIPRWVAEDADLLARTQTLAFDQARKGNGYPVALSEAHERAVVRGPERDAFFRLVENALVRDGIPAAVTRKALSKRTRVL